MTTLNRAAETMKAERIQFDLKNVPEGVIPTLVSLALQRGLTVGVYCRTVLIEHALAKGETHERQA